ncbi:hypothetical protein N7491_002716 [Penicillium cf. griseofulvum]|uniref:Uncharacterized protein n=1 Tax=Penicillium cf. griseofulvum TaxID=2972120 RepID=A0A9W9MSF3_9EURO|nr:hypothetical protein N7472_003117 [Penicillium cf. griseofulvum]KAJ5440310.1 hypothetical protein N7491_002716 [Penicillium cf. griseofulvum]KAJ5448358.1 hypothetical protein N7445_003179 [Penicillium cf. griseofulvum]
MELFPAARQSESRNGLEVPRHPQEPRLVALDSATHFFHPGVGFEWDERVEDEGGFNCREGKGRRRQFRMAV